MYQCELCGRDILRIEKEIWMRAEGYARVTRKGNLDHNSVMMLKSIGGVACQTCVELGGKGNPADLPPTLF